MNPTQTLAWTSPRPNAASPVRELGRMEAWARERLFERLRGLREGRILWRDARGETTLGSSQAEVCATVDVHDPAVYLDLALGGGVGAAEAYMDGRWSCGELVELVRMLVRDRAVLDGLEGGLARLATPGLRWLHARRANTREGSRRNIAAHYDLGNDFYRLFLDESLMYSCAFFEHAGQSLEAAQAAKLERVCRKLGLRPGQRLLEIGTGWGSMAIHAAKHHGVHVTTTTISREQHALASERVRRAGLEGRVDVRLDDYRDLRGRFDRLVSIEMVEAVGERYLDTYMRACSDALEPHGAMLLQAITLKDQFYASALRNVDFIQKHIFPGSFIPSVGAIAERTTRVTDMKIADLEDIGPHYAPTLHEWRRRFHANLESVRALGFDDRFLRMWDYYLAYCEGGFRERVLGDVQVLFVKPDFRGEVGWRGA